jgi:hypothetical protein
MIQLHPDYLLFETPKGQLIPCSAEMVAVELVGEASSSLDPELVQQAASAVLHYFKQDLGLQTVSVGEFSRALEQALAALGLRSTVENLGRETRSYDLRQLAVGAGRGFELSFFPQLRQEIRAQLESTPTVLRFYGLRGCVKQLMGARRWSQRCQVLNDQIVEFLRACLVTEAAVSRCGLVVC